MSTLYRSCSLLLTGIFSSLASLGQLQELANTHTKWITLGEVKWLANTKASLKYFVSKADTTYLLYLQDDQKLKSSTGMTVTEHFSIPYNGADNTTGKLYELLTSFYNLQCSYKPLNTLVF